MILFHGDHTAPHDPPITKAGVVTPTPTPDWLVCCWLPFYQHNRFKIVHNCHVGCAMSYLTIFFTLMTCLAEFPFGQLPCGFLVIPHMCTAMAQSRSSASFRHSSWNRLPQDLHPEILSSTIVWKLSSLSAMTLALDGNATDSWVVRVTGASYPLE